MLPGYGMGAGAWAEREEGLPWGTMSTQDERVNSQEAWEPPWQGREQRSHTARGDSVPRSVLSTRSTRRGRQEAEDLVGHELYVI